MAINRRDFLRLGGTGLALGTIAPALTNPWMTRPLQAAMMGSPAKKMLILFLRGGMDSANVLVPNGDEDVAQGYNDINRPTLFIAPEDGIDLGNDFAYANPDLAVMTDTIPDTDLALIHRVGYVGQSRSHFSSQQYWENATPGNLQEQGWVNNLVLTDSDLNDLALPAASCSNTFQVLFRGERPMAHIPNLETYSLGDDDYDLKLLGALPDGDDGTGLLGIYSRGAEDLPYDALVRGDGISLSASLNELADNNVDPTTYAPAGGATYPSASAPGDFPGDGGAWNYFRQVKDAVQLLKETDCRVTGVELGGFDTHSNQADRLPRLMRLIAQTYSSAYLDMDAGGFWDDTLVVMVSEFSRTSAENGSFGTDHGEAGVVFMAGGNVNGGVYNCDSTTWAQGDLFSTPVSNPRYIAQNTDFRTILAEIMEDHFGLDSNQVDDVIPGWSDLSGDVFDSLGCMS